MAIAAIIGTARKSPATPQIRPQKLSDRTIANELRFSDRPSISVWTTLARMKCTALSKMAMIRKVSIESD